MTPPKKDCVGGYLSDSSVPFHNFKLKRSQGGGGASHPIHPLSIRFWKPILEIRFFFYFAEKKYLALRFYTCVNSYNKLEEDFQSEQDPLRAYNDYLEEVETISMDVNNYL